MQNGLNIAQELAAAAELVKTQDHTTKYQVRSKNIRHDLMFHGAFFNASAKLSKPNFPNNPSLELVSSFRSIEDSVKDDSGKSDEEPIQLLSPHLQNPPSKIGNNKSEPPVISRKSSPLEIKAFIQFYNQENNLRWDEAKCNIIYLGLVYSLHKDERVKLEASLPVYKGTKLDVFAGAYWLDKSNDCAYDFAKENNLQWDLNSQLVVYCLYAYYLCVFDSVTKSKIATYFNNAKYVSTILNDPDVNSCATHFEVQWSGLEESAFIKLCCVVTHNQFYLAQENQNSQINGADNPKNDAIQQSANSAFKKR